MIEFRYHFESDREINPKIIFRLPAQSDLPTVLEAFNDFLKGAGYVFDGVVSIVDEESSKDE